MISYKELTQGRNLFVGAHPDDIFIGAAILITKNPKNSFALTITNGAPPFEIDYPVVVEGLPDMQTPAAYASQREREDRKVMSTLGIPKDQLTYLRIPDQKSHEHLEEVIGGINRVINTFNPDRIFTHEFPQAHPDHEISCFAVHQAVKENGEVTPVFEFPLYVIIPGEERVNCELTDSPLGNIVEHTFSEEELRLRNQLMRLYKSQPDIPERYTTTREQFRQIQRSFDGEQSLTNYIEGIKVSTPELIREEIRAYLNKNTKAR